MKKVIYIISILSITAAYVFAGSVGLSEVPKSAIAFADKYFSDYYLFRATETSGNYTLIFKGGLKIYVNIKGEWKTISGGGEEISIDYVEDKVKKTKEMARNFEKGITESINRYYEFLIKISKELNIEFRDISFSRINVEQYNLDVQKDKKVRARLVEKEGALNKFKRFLGGFFNTDWGYKEVEEVNLEVNKEATEKKIKEYIDKIKAIYSKTVEEYRKQFYFITNEFYLALDKEKRSYEDKQKNLLNEREAKNLIEELDRLLNNYRRVKHNNIS